MDASNSMGCVETWLSRLKKEPYLSPALRFLRTDDAHFYIAGAFSCRWFDRTIKNTADLKRFVLIVGGGDATAELFDPATGTFSFTGPPIAGRLHATATLSDVHRSRRRET